ncbi:MAG: hypothetical protein GX434_17570 [Peptococcaceae bacterium]|nr:hypothetical protein [Peptococcaceae bacterium]
MISRLAKNGEYDELNHYLEKAGYDSFPGLVPGQGRTEECVCGVVVFRIPPWCRPGWPPPCRAPGGRSPSL